MATRNGNNLVSNFHEYDQVRILLLELGPLLLQLCEFVLLILLILTEVLLLITTILILIVIVDVIVGCVWAMVMCWILMGLGLLCTRFPYALRLFPFDSSRRRFGSEFGLEVR